MELSASSGSENGRQKKLCAGKIHGFNPPSLISLRYLDVACCKAQSDKFTFTTAFKVVECRHNAGPVELDPVGGSGRPQRESPTTTSFVRHIFSTVGKVKKGVGH